VDAARQPTFPNPPDAFKQSSASNIKLPLFAYDLEIWKISEESKATRQTKKAE
jgi:hypothetical protein